MFKQRVYDLVEVAAVLTHLRVLDLDDVDAVLVDHAVQEPFEVAVGEFADGMRDDRAEGEFLGLQSEEELGIAAAGSEFVVGFDFPVFIDEH